MARSIEIMPIYEYTCGSCGAVFDELVCCDDNEAVRCDSCGCDRVERRPSVFAAQQSTAAFLRRRWAVVGAAGILTAPVRCSLIR